MFDGVSNLEREDSEEPIELASPKAIVLQGMISPTQFIKGNPRPSRPAQPGRLPIQILGDVASSLTRSGGDPIFVDRVVDDDAVGKHRRVTKTPSS